MSSFADKIMNKKDKTTSITLYKCDKCGISKNKFFIHLNIDNSDKYICSYLCSTEMLADYGKGYWNKYVVNVEDFKHPKPLIIKQEHRNMFEMGFDCYNRERNELLEELRIEDERVAQMINAYDEVLSNSDYESE